MTVFRSRRQRAAEWVAENPVLAPGELGLESDTHSLKAGDGATHWNLLPYVGTIGGPQPVLTVQGEVAGMPSFTRALSMTQDGRLLVTTVFDAGKVWTDIFDAPWGDVL
jgi:hypothetical protein